MTAVAGAARAFATSAVMAGAAAAAATLLRRRSRRVRPSGAPGWAKAFSPFSPALPTERAEDYSSCDYSRLCVWSGDPREEVHPSTAAQGRAHDLSKVVRRPRGPPVPAGDRPVLGLPGRGVVQARG